MNIVRPACLALATLALVACTEEEGGGSPPPAEIAGHYTLTLTQNNTTCVGDWDYFEIFAFAVDTGAAPSVTMDLAQDGSAIAAVLGPDSGCELAGSVGTDGTFNLSGPCDDDAMDRNLRLFATSSPFGANLDVEGNMVIEVDGVPGVPGGADGEVDCEVDDITVRGSGTPEEES